MAFRGHATHPCLTSRDRLQIMSTSVCVCMLTRGDLKREKTIYCPKKVNIKGYQIFLFKLVDFICERSLIRMSLAMKEQTFSLLN